MSTDFLESLAKQTEALKAEGLYKQERIITGPQQAAIEVLSGDDIGVKVGPGETAADYRVDDPHAVKEVLQRILRSAHR